MSGRAFLLRMNPLGIDRVPIARSSNEVTIGWGKCGAELLNPRLDRDAFANHVHRTYYAADSNRIASGKSAGQLWRFIRDMSPRDLVLVPRWDQLHVAELLGDPAFDSNAEHWAYRRNVRWMTPERGRQRSDADEKLRSALRSQLTCFDLTGLIKEVRDLVD